MSLCFYLVSAVKPTAAAPAPTAAPAAPGVRGESRVTHVDITFHIFLSYISICNNLASKYRRITMTVVSCVQVKMNRMRLRIAQRLKEAQNTCAMLTTFNEVDMR